MNGRKHQPGGVLTSQKVSEAATAPTRRAEHALLLAGWGTDPARLDPIRDHIRAAGVPATVWEYRAAGTIDLLGSELRDTVAGLGGTVHLVGHSLGGLVAAHAATDGAASIASVTTINTPWRGTWAGWTGESELAEQLRWGSTALMDLRQRFATHVEEPAGPRWLLIGCLGDLATPPTTSLRPGTTAPRVTRRLLTLAGHSLSLLRPTLAATVASHVTGGPAR